MIAPLDNSVIFKKVFSDLDIFKQFIKDIFNIEISVSKIETEKRFSPKIGNIDFALDIYAETDDHRCIIEIQRIDYDYNFDRFLHYFLMVIAEQQKSASEYKFKQDVLSVVILTRPYKINQRTGEPIRDSVMVMDFNPHNLKKELVDIWGHQFVWLNPHPKYKEEGLPKSYQDWLDLFYCSMSEPVNYRLNMGNLGIAKAVSMLDYEQIDPSTLEAMKIDEGKKIMLNIIKKEGLIEGKKEGLIEGKKEGLIEGEKIGINKIAINAIYAGLTNDIIKQLTSLSDDEINALRNS